MHEEGDHGGHEPIVSFAPVILAIGIFFFNLGIGFKSAPLGVIGVAVFTLGLLVWIREDMVYYRKGSGSEHG